MILATLFLKDALDPEETFILELTMSPGYGTSPEVAHEVLLLCITVAECPVVVDAQGELWPIPNRSLRALLTRST